MEFKLTVGLNISLHHAKGEEERGERGERGESGRAIIKGLSMTLAGSRSLLAPGIPR